MENRMQIDVPEFDDEENDIAKWLQIAIWVITVVVELLKKIKEAQQYRDKIKNK